MAENHPQAREFPGDSGERFKALADDARHAIFIIRNDRIYFANKAACVISGYGEDELGAMPFLDLVHEDFKEAVERQVAARQRGKKIEPLRECMILTRKGEIKWVELSAKRLRFEGCPAILGTACDITERKQTEEALRASEEKYRLLAENVTDVIWTAKIKPFRMTYVSPSVRGILGYTPRECMELPLKKILTPDSLEKVKTFLNGELQAPETKENDGGGRQMLELAQIHKDGRIVWTEVTTNILRDPDRVPIGFLGVTRDVTKRREDAEKKRRLEDRLRQSHEIEALGRVSAGIAHDFNNFLGNIAIFAQSAMIHVEENPKAGAYLEKIMDSCMKAKDLVRQILSLSTSKKLRLEALRLGPVIDEALGLTKPALPENIRVRKRIFPGVGKVAADPVEIHRVFMNLFANAVHAMKETGGTLEVTLDSVRREDAPQNGIPGNGDLVKLTVGDTGPGIAPEILERVFEPCFTTKKKGEGSGFGLALVSNIVRAHGGMATADNAAEGGAVFTLYFPELEK